MQATSYGYLHSLRGTGASPLARAPPPVFNEMHGRGRPCDGTTGEAPVLRFDGVLE